jgi:hypothetical protein
MHWIGEAKAATAMRVRAVSNVVELQSAADQQDEPITGRGLAMLRAVSDGRAELACSCEPDLFIDGLGCCDQYTAHRLARAGLIRPAVPGAIGQRVRAELTVAGRAILS